MKPRTAAGRWVTLVVCSLVVPIALACDANADPITLMWDEHPDPAVVSFRLYVGVQSGVYSQSFDTAGANSFVYPDAVPGQRYCFAVSAYAAGPLEGARSGEVCGFSNASPTLQSPGNQFTELGQPVTLQLQGSDPAGQPVSYGASGLPSGLSLTSSTGFIAGTGTTAGTYAVTATVSDGVLTAAQSFTWTMTIPDRTPPTVTIAAPTSAATYATSAATITLAGTALDNVGVSRVEWVNDRGGAGTAVGSANWRAEPVPLESGSNMLTVTVHDAAGNTARAVVTVTSDPTESVTLRARAYTVKGRKNVELLWTTSSWNSVAVYRNGVHIVTTANDGTHTDSLRKGGTYRYRVCAAGSAQCSNEVAINF
jgi:hypothetical protein